MFIFRSSDLTIRCVCAKKIIKWVTTSNALRD